MIRGPWVLFLAPRAGLPSHIHGGSSIQGTTDTTLALLTSCFDPDPHRVSHLRIPLLTASRCPRATEKPMARGAEPPKSRRLRSVVASTHSTSCRVPMISMPRPWPEFTPRASCKGEKKEGPVSGAGGDCNENPRALGPGTNRQSSSPS